MLTGQCKKDFEKWYKEENPNKFDSSMVGAFLGNYKPYFELIPFSMQYGVYADFFDSFGIHLLVEPYLDFKKDLLFKGYILFHKNINEQNSFTKRKYAIESVIELANEIYNAKKK